MTDELYPLWLRAWHGLHALCFLVLGATGLSLHYNGEWFAVLRFDIAIRLHDSSGIALIALYVLFVVANAKSNMRHYSLPRPIVGSLLRQLRWYLKGMFNGDPRPFPRARTKKLNPLQSATYLVVMYALTPASVMSGIALMVPQFAPERVAGAGGVWPMALLHLATGWGLSLFLLLHIYMVTTGPRPHSYLVEIVRGLPASDLDDGTLDATEPNLTSEEVHHVDPAPRG